jgi:hypothetical protein
MTIELRTQTVGELHALTQSLLDQGLRDLPVCATDCRARYPFEAYTVLNQSGSTDALLIYVRPDAHFASRDPLPVNWGPDRVAGWNREADTIKLGCGAFGDRQHEDAPSYHDMKAALEKILASTNPGADESNPELRGLGDSDRAKVIAEIAGAALRRK